MNMITSIHGHVVFYSTIFILGELLKNGGNIENCHKDGISTICYKIILFRKLQNSVIEITVNKK